MSKLTQNVGGTLKTIYQAGAVTDSMSYTWYGRVGLGTMQNATTMYTASGVKLDPGTTSCEGKPGVIIEVPYNQVEKGIYIRSSTIQANCTAIVYIVAGVDAVTKYCGGYAGFTITFYNTAGVTLYSDSVFVTQGNAVLPYKEEDKRVVYKMPQTGYFRIVGDFGQSGGISVGGGGYFGVCNEDNSASPNDTLTYNLNA